MLHSVTGNPFFAKGIFAFDTLLFGSFFKIEEKYVEREKQPHKWGTYIHDGRFLFMSTSVFIRYSLYINMKYIRIGEMSCDNSSEG